MTARALPRALSHSLVGSALAISCLLLSACTAPQQAVRPVSAAATPASPPAAPVIDDLDTLELVRAEVAAARRPAGPPQAQIPAEQARFRQVTDNDLWHRVRAGFAINEPLNSRIIRERDWYAKHDDYLRRVSERASPYLYLVVEELERQGLPLELALLPIVESAYKPFAYSHGRAAGLWQFIPSTGRLYGLKQNWWYDGRRDVYAATRAAAKFLRRLGDDYQGDWLLALAAYNAGPGNVNKAVKRNRKRGKPTDFWNLSLPRETMQYVPRLLAMKELFTRPADYGISIARIEDAPALTQVDTGGQLDLAVAAELSGLSIEEIYRLNPGFNRWATAPDGPHRLLLPHNVADTLTTALKKLPAKQRVTWKRHKIKNGETLSHIADRHGVSVPVLRKVNQLSGSQIRAGRHLLVPSASRRLSEYSLSASSRLAALQSGAGKSRRGKRVEHKVLPGDTLWDLSRSYGVGVRKIAAWNGMAPRDALKPGRKLVIWLPRTQQIDAANGSNLAHTQRALATQTIRYTVRRGDSLAGIAQRFKIRVADLKRWNAKVSKDRYLQPGQQLNLHLDVRHQSG